MAESVSVPNCARPSWYSRLVNACVFLGLGMGVPWPVLENPPVPVPL